MGINEQGIEAERKARLWLKKKGITNLQQIDWIIKFKDKYYCIECKSRELFKPPPFWGTGLDKSQLWLRQNIYKDLGIDTYLLVFEVGTENVYWEKISVLEKGKFFDTKNNIRIYKIENFNKETTKRVSGGTR